MEQNNSILPDHHELLNENGFTLIEVLVAMTLMATIGLMLSNVVVNSQRAVQSTTATSDFNSLVTTIQGILNNSTNCQTALGVNTLVPGTAPGNFPQAIQAIRAGQPGEPPGPVIIPAAPVQIGNTLKITNLEFSGATPMGAPSTNQYLAPLYFAGTKVVGAGGAVGTQTVSHTFNIVLQIDPSTNKIIACSGQDDSLWLRANDYTDIYYSAGNVGIGTGPSAPPVISANAPPLSSNLQVTGGLTVGTWGYPNPLDPTVGDGLGPAIQLGGATTSNTDPLLLQRNNFGPDTSELRVVIGDNAIEPGVEDWFTVGAWDRLHSNQWYPRFTVHGSTGFVGINTTTPAYYLDVTGDINTTSCLRVGGAQAVGACSSDQRLKTDIRDYRLGLKELVQLQPKIYKLNGLGGLKKGTEEVGFIAQEVEKVMPSLVVNREVKLHSEDKEKTEIQAVNYTRFTFIAINSIKELYSDLGTLDARIAKLEASASRNPANTEDTKSPETKLDEPDRNVSEIARLTAENHDLRLRMDRIEKLLK